MQEALQKRFPRLRLEVHVCDAAQNVGAMVRQAIEAGWMCIVRYESVSFKRWSTVIGVEVAVAVASREVRALLLLDSHASEPWACGHNARIELQGIADQSARATPGFNLRYRHLAGQASQVRLCSLITTRRLA